MSKSRTIPGPEIWIRQLFEAKAAHRGGVIRRKRRDIERHAGWDRLLAEVDRRGFHLIEAGDQILILCHCGPLRVIR